MTWIFPDFNSHKNKMEIDKANNKNKHTSYKKKSKQMCKNNFGDFSMLFNDSFISNYIFGIEQASKII